MTYRERREAKAERLREWAEKRQDKANALYARGDPYRGDVAFNTQPGHIPERARVIAAIDRSFEEANKAASMRDRAAGIENQLERSIYSDDPDAAERISEKIAELEAEHARRKAINAAIRKGGIKAAEHLMTEQDKKDLLMIAQFQPYYDPEHKGFPAYDLSNRNNNIRRYRERLAALSQPPRKRTIFARRPGTCPTCGNPIEPQTPITEDEPRVWVHAGCAA